MGAGIVRNFYSSIQQWQSGSGKQRERGLGHKTLDKFMT